MRTAGLLAVFSLVMAGFVPSFGFGEDELTDLAEGHWAAIAASDLAALVEDYAPEASFLAWGIEDRGALGVREAAAFWDSFAEGFGGYQLEKIHVLPQVNTVVSRLSFSQAAGALEAISALKFDEAGKIVAEDFVVLGAGFFPDGTVEDGEYPNRISDKSTGMELHFLVGPVLLYVGLEAPGTGWLAVGFDAQLGMAGANIVIAAVSGGELVIEDHYGSSRTSHRKDEINHVLFAAGREDPAGAKVEFAIPLESGDPQDRPLAKGGTYRVILAYQKSSDSFRTRHTRRATLELVLE